MENHDLTLITAEVVSAYVSHNPVPAGELTNLIKNVHNAFKDLSRTVEATTSGLPKREPAVHPKKSVFPDHIICLEDGLRFKSLKRHLSSRFGLSPEQYRQRWDLPADYPMVAPNYSVARSALAKKMGLGRKTKGSRATAH